MKELRLVKKNVIWFWNFFKKFYFSLNLVIKTMAVLVLCKEFLIKLQLECKKYLRKNNISPTFHLYAYGLPQLYILSPQ